MLTQPPARTIPLPASLAPRLVVMVDTEEEFDWNQPHNRAEIAVTSMRAQPLAHRVFDRFGIVPTYVTDYAVASQDIGAGVLRELASGGHCLVGSHLHPWVNPPHDEMVNARNSYAGNLPAALEQEKLARLTGEIERNIGVRPRIFRAGRYGVGPNTAAILRALDYRVDSSIVPFHDFRDDGGPDFRAFRPGPYWLDDDRTLLEIPLAAGFAGRARALGPDLYAAATAPLAMTVRAPGILARLGLVERIRLTPEGVDLAALKRLTRALLSDGQRVFVFSYHSPSLAPGHTPYVRDTRDLEAFLALLEQYFHYFINELGGLTATPLDILALAAECSTGAMEGLRQ